MTCPRDAGNKNIDNHWLRPLPTLGSSCRSGTLKHVSWEEGGAILTVNLKHKQSTHAHRGWQRPPCWDGRGAQCLAHGPQKAPAKPAEAAGLGAQSPRRICACENWCHPGSLQLSRAVVIHSQCPERPSRGSWAGRWCKWPRGGVLTRGVLGSSEQLETQAAPEPESELPEQPRLSWARP